MAVKKSAQVSVIIHLLRPGIDPRLGPRLIMATLNVLVVPSWCLIALIQYKLFE